jgi:Ras-related C3 botulinum toxin substrate 1
MKHIKCVLVGDGPVGKTCSIITYITNAYPRDSTPVTLESSARLTVEDTLINLQLWDTASQPDYQNLRPLSYPDTDIFIICFSLVSPTSLDNVQSKWVPEIKQHCEDNRYILVGMKSDLRPIVAVNPADWRVKGMEAVPQARGESMKRDINAQAYIECSAKMQTNLKEVFETAIKVVLHQPKKTEPEHHVQHPHNVSGGVCCEIFETI